MLGYYWCGLSYTAAAVNYWLLNIDLVIAHEDGQHCYGIYTFKEWLGAALKRTSMVMRL